MRCGGGGRVVSCIQKVGILCRVSGVSVLMCVCVCACVRVCVCACVRVCVRHACVCQVGIMS